jgi:hypothetical protein
MRLVDVVTVEVTATASPEPKPVRQTTAVPQAVLVLWMARAWPGNPERSCELMTIAGVIVRDAEKEFVPSLTTMVCAPPARTGTFADTLKSPEAVVVRQPPTMRLFTEPVPLLANAPNGDPQVAAVSQGTVVVLTAVVIAIGCAGRNPVPVKTRVEKTFADVTVVETPLVRVDRVTLGPAACAELIGSRKTIPVTPARNNSPIVPNEASLLFGVICVCILFTIFVAFTFLILIYNTCGRIIYIEERYEPRLHNAKVSCPFFKN